MSNTASMDDGHQKNISRVHTPLAEGCVPTGYFCSLHLSIRFVGGHWYTWRCPFLGRAQLTRTASIHETYIWEVCIPQAWKPQASQGSSVQVRLIGILWVIGSTYSGNDVIGGSEGVKSRERAPSTQLQDAVALLGKLDVECELARLHVEMLGYHSDKLPEYGNCHVSVVWREVS